jgi:O-acetyl-ADP-ribose deacetylase (regulator of RNase III)
MIQNVRGDILQTSAHYIAQGVATGSQEGLGTGLALKISQKWPLVQKQSKKYTHANRFQGGDIYVVPPSTSHPGVIYIATQLDMYHASPTYLNRGIKELAWISTAQHWPNGRPCSSESAESLLRGNYKAFW